MDEETKTAMESGNPVMIFHIGNVGQMNPSATTVNNTYYGDQFVPNEEKHSSGRQPKPERKSSLPQISPKKDSKPRELMTFSLKGVLQANITCLYSKLVDEKWIMPETPEQDFQDLFSGKRSESRIIWADKYGKSTLVFLFQYMEAQDVISVPKSFSIPNILMGHFVDKEGNYLTNLDHGDAPAQKAGQEVIEFVEIMKVKPNHILRQEDSSVYGSSINPYELENEGLRYRGNKHGSGQNSGME